MQTTTTWLVLLVVLASLLTVGISGAAAGMVADGEVESTDLNGEVVSLDHPETVSPDGEFELTVETKASAGTIVAAESDEIDIILSTEEDDVVQTEADRLEFLDVSGDDSTYTIGVDTEGGTAGDSIAVTAWVNSEDQADADDSVSTDIPVQDDSQPPEDAPVADWVADAETTPAQFRAFDQTGNGELTDAEVRESVSEYLIEGDLNDVGLSDTDIRQLIAEYVINS